MTTRPQNMINFLLKFLPICGLLLGMAGCVDINDAKVQVQQPEQIDPYSRSLIDKCPPHTNPHRLLIGQTGSNSPMGQGSSFSFQNQQDFDKWWGYLSSVDMGQASISSLSQEPVINWDQETVLMIVMGSDSSCQKVKPFGDEMTTDCKNITITLYRYTEGSNCQPPTSVPVYIYIYPKTPLPVGVQWFYPTPVPSATPKPTATMTPLPTLTPTPTPSSEDE